MSTSAGNLDEAAHALLVALRRAGITDERVFDAFRRVPRELFVPAESVHLAREDVPVRIGLEQVTTQPSLMAMMISALDLTGRERVLEVGTGFGFQTALLAVLCREVFSVERFPELARRARHNLAIAGISNAHVAIGDGTFGQPEHAPYDAALIAAAAPLVPRPIVEQLAVDAPLVHPVGPGGAEDVVLFRKRQGILTRVRSITRAYFVPLVGAYGQPE